MIKSFLFIFFSFLVAATKSYAIDRYEKCCFCVQDPQDAAYSRKQCDRWFEENSRALGCQKKQLILDYQQVRIEGQYRCNTVHAYGAFHGLSSMLHIPFQIADNLTYDLRPRELNYDGSSCLLFNNIEQGREQARVISLRYPGVKFNMRGNQNSGITEMLAFIGSPKEVAAASSKVSFVSKGNSLAVSYDSCSVERQLCYFSTEDREATSDSNAKFCSSGGKVVTQRCCRSQRGAGEGKWAAHGKICTK